MKSLPPAAEGATPCQQPIVRKINIDKGTFSALVTTRFIAYSKWAFSTSDALGSSTRVRPWQPAKKINRKKSNIKHIYNG